MKLISFVLCTFFCWGSLAFGETVATPGLRVYTVGHSFHFWVGPMLGEIAQSAGIKDHQVVGVMGVGGSTVQKCWDKANAAKPAAEDPAEQPAEIPVKKAITSGAVDVLTLSPIWLPDEGIEKFAELGLKYNPNLRVTVQKFWLPNDTYEPIYPLDVRKTPPVDHNAANLVELGEKQARYDHDVDEFVKVVNKRLGQDAIVTVPVGRAVLALREKIVAGQAPGMDKQSELFRDPWGHPTKPLQVLSAYCYFAVVYHRSPVGLPMPEELQGKYRNEGLNRLLQELAWNAVTHDPLSGVDPSW